MLDYDSLIAPIDGASPVGPDLRGEPDFRDIEDMPGDFANLKSPELKGTIATCETFFRRSKDQMPLIVAVQAAVRIGDFALVNAGLALVKGLAETYWEAFHPGPADEMVIGRINELSALSRPAAMVLPLQRAAVAALPAPSTAGFTAAMVAQSLVPTPEWSSRDEEALKAQMDSGQMTGAGARAVRPNREGGRQLRMIMRSLSPAARQADSEANVSMDDSEIDPAMRERLAHDLRGQVTASRDQLRIMSDTFYEINEIYDRHSGDSASLGPVFSTIKSMIDDADRFITLFAPEEAAAAEAEGHAAGDPAPAAAPGEARAAAAAPKAFTVMTPRSRDDVKIAIDALCGYYSVHEPSSPVAPILKRARGWVDKDFMELIKELLPNAQDDAEKLLASREQSEQ